MINLNAYHFLKDLKEIADHLEGNVEYAMLNKI